MPSLYITALCQKLAEPVQPQEGNEEIKKGDIDIEGVD